MTSEAGPQGPRPGWYDDPMGADSLRWWSGESWTEHVQAKAAPASVAVEPVAVPAVTSTSAPSVSPTLTGAPTSLFAEHVPLQYLGSDELAAAHQPTFVDLPGGWTPAVRSMALLPLVSVAFTVLSITLGWSNGASLGLSGVLTVTSVGIAYADRTRIREAGLHGASPWWTLLTPIGYLIARYVVLRGQGVRSPGPGWLYLGCAVVAGVISAFVIIPNYLDAQDALVLSNVESVLETELAAQTQVEWKATCPADVDVRTIGTQFSCLLTEVTGDRAVEAVLAVVGLWQVEIIDAVAVN